MTEIVPVLALCESCGWWNDMTLKPSSPDVAMPAVLHPRCWVCSGALTFIRPSPAQSRGPTS